MKYLVTGATGFAGRHLCQHLVDSGHEVASLVRRGGTAPGQTLELVADLHDESAVRRAVASFQPDGIFHLAAPETSPWRSKQFPAETIRGNLVTTLSILEAARLQEESPRVIVISSIVLTQPVDTPYALSKKTVEETAELYRKLYDLPVMVARPSNHTGPGQTPDFAVPNFAKQTAEIEAGTRDAYEVRDVAARKDFSDVRDVVRAYNVLMEKGTPGETYVVASGKTVLMADVLAFLASLSTVTIDSVPSADPQAVPEPEPLDISPLNALGWQPEIDTEQTWRDLMEEARRNLSKRSA